MSTQAQMIGQKDEITRAREVFVRLSLIALMAFTCFVIMKPFVPLVSWGIIIAIGIYPGYQKLSVLLGGRKTLAAVICTLLLIAVMLVPAILLTGTVSRGAQSVARQVQGEGFKVPPPPPSVKEWPVIGKWVSDKWMFASTNLEDLLGKIAPLIQARIPALLSASAKIGATLLQFLISILVAGFLVARDQANARFARQLFHRVFGQRGEEFEELTAATIRSVTNGILGVALIQSVFASAGFWAVGLPGAGIWAALFFVASVLQIGPLVMIPAIVYAFTIATTTHAAIFLGWCMVVGLMDNVLKPLLLGRGSKVPTAVIFLGVIGGFITMGIIGLFVGAIILSVGYKLFLAWLWETSAPQLEG
jgi:predicted PurR-regulated permease PerM